MKVIGTEQTSWLENSQSELILSAGFPVHVVRDWGYFTWYPCESW